MLARLRTAERPGAVRRAGSAIGFRSLGRLHHRGLCHDPAISARNAPEPEPEPSDIGRGSLAIGAGPVSQPPPDCQAATGAGQRPSGAADQGEPADPLRKPAGRQEAADGRPRRSARAGSRSPCPGSDDGRSGSRHWHARPAARRAADAGRRRRGGEKTQRQTGRPHPARPAIHTAQDRAGNRRLGLCRAHHSRRHLCSGSRQHSRRRGLGVDVQQVCRCLRHGQSVQAAGHRRLERRPSCAAG